MTTVRPPHVGETLTATGVVRTVESLAPEGHLRVTLDVAPEPAPLWFGRVDTGHYLFEALGADRHEAELRLLDAYAQHAVETPYADPDLMAERIEEDEVSWTVMAVGHAARDGEVIV